MLIRNPDFNKAFAADRHSMKVKHIMEDTARLEKFGGQVDPTAIRTKMRFQKDSPLDVEDNPLTAVFKLADSVTFGWATKAAKAGAMGEVGKNAVKDTTFAEEVGQLAIRQADKGSSIGTGAGKKKKRRRAMATKTIGFGQQESAMTTINRSLRRTHRMLKTLDGRIGKLPAADNDTTPGKP
jgi:hypothetical protein